MNPGVDLYLEDGCGRCDLYKTPQCKVHKWIDELELLRSIVLRTGLTEEIKWGVPCYTYCGKNVLIVSAFNNYASISFFKGALLNDDENLLEKPGENTQAARLIKFNEVDQIKALEDVLESYIYEAIEIEESGQKVEMNKKPEEMPEEFAEKLESDPALKMAFEALTPGRQRGYNLYFSGAKQSKTRMSRIEKYVDKIMEGKGFYD